MVFVWFAAASRLGDRSVVGGFLLSSFLVQCGCLLGFRSVVWGFLVLLFFVFGRFGGCRFSVREVGIITLVHFGLPRADNIYFAELVSFAAWVVALSLKEALYRFNVWPGSRIQFYNRVIVLRIVARVLPLDLMGSFVRSVLFYHYHKALIVTVFFFFMFLVFGW